LSGKTSVALTEINSQFTAKKPIIFYPFYKPFIGNKYLQQKAFTK